MVAGALAPYFASSSAPTILIMQDEMLFVFLYGRIS